MVKKYSLYCYKIVFDIDKTSVRILSMFHTAQNQNKLIDIR